MFNIFSLILGLVPAVVQGIQSVHGDVLSGADKKTMAHDALNAAISGATAVLGGNNAVFAQIAGAVASIAIDQTVTIAKATGAYAKWTAIATAAQTAGAVGAAATSAVEGVAAGK